MNIDLLAHSFVGAGVLRTLPDVRLGLTYAGAETERVPAPNLLRAMRDRAIRSAAFFSAIRINYNELTPGDLLISANWRHKIPQEVLDLYPLAVNFHGSDTTQTKYRGRAPIQRQIADQRKLFTLTLHELAEQYDAGPVLAQRQVQFDIVPTEAMVYEAFGELAEDLTQWLLRQYANLLEAKALR